jgi:ATP-dependent Clp protease ATP-binding subunit ClpB
MGIADIMLGELKQSLKDRGLSVTWDEEIRAFLVKKAYSITYGARNLRRTIQKELEDPISEKIIESFDNPIESIHIAVENDAVIVSAQ